MCTFNIPSYDSQMSSQTAYLRILGYAVTIVMHVGNIVFMNFCIKREYAIDPELKMFSKLQPRYFTCWTFFLQIVYAGIGLVCEYLLISNSNDKLYKLPKHLKGLKQTLFSAVLWPSTWVVFSVFWSLFIYDRKLIFPSFADKVVTPISNHIMHTAIVGVILWEVMLQPRTRPQSHSRNLFHLGFHLALYFSVLVYTFIHNGIWIYPIFDLLYGTIYFPLLPLTIASMAFGFYYMQWPLTDVFWKNTERTKKIK